MHKEIISVNNELVKQVSRLQQKKYRDEEKKFLLEGFKPIEEAFLSKIEIETIFVNKTNQVMLNRLENLLSQKQNATLYPSPASRHFISGRRRDENTDLILTTEPVLKKISTTDSAPDAVAAARQRIFTLNDIKDAKKVVLLENIKDLGNLGTILRTAKAFSQDAVILFGDTADLYNPKCIRSAAGNLWKIPVVQIKDLNVLKKTFKDFDKIATLPRGKSLKTLKVQPPYLIMFGSEADGLTRELIDLSNQKTAIKINEEVESLNLSVSVGIVLNSFL